MSAEIDRLAALLEAGTPGPWKATGDTHQPIIAPTPPKITRRGKGLPKEIAQPDTAVCKLDNTAACGDPDCCPDDPFVAIDAVDAALIVAAVNALPRLLAVARAAERFSDARDAWLASDYDEEAAAGVEIDRAHDALDAALAALDTP